MRLALAVILVMACRTAGAAGIEFRTPPIEPGSPPIVQVTGLADGQVVRLWTVRSFTKWQEVEGRWVEVPVTLYAWADFVAVKGRVDSTAMPSLQGTYRGRDPYGLMWSGRTRGSAGIREKYSRIRFKFLMLRAFLLHTPLRPRSGLLALRVETE
ncbi:acyl-CoA thioesterase/BAAT N-terminal domain-containing protein [Stenotrophomonas maltophilia]|nr:acyl-CoA thioesterase/BAAT N-terminal domain-containing protein [Stenotrophomonas maltophilia]